MDGHHIADPWDLPENPPTPESGGVTTAPKPAKPSLFGRRPDDPVSPDDPVPVDDPPGDDVAAAEPAAYTTTDAPLEEADVADDAGWTAASDQATGAGPAFGVAENDDPVETPARFDLGLEPNESAWEPTDDSGTAPTTFGLVTPSNDVPGSDEPAYEVDEPTLSDEFMGTNAPGRPDHSTPQLRDPLTILSLDEDSVPGEEPDPGASIVTLDGEAGVDVGDDTTAGSTAEIAEATDHDSDEHDEPRGFRLPGLSLFARSRGAHEAPNGGVPNELSDTDAPPREVPAELSPEVISETIAAPDDTSTPIPDPAVSAAAVIAEIDDFTAPEAEPAEVPEVSSASVDEPVVADPSSDPFADEAAEAGIEAAVAETPVADTTPVVSVDDVTEAHETGVDVSEDVEIELIEPDLTEYVDVETLYVTEEATEEPTRTALVTVDGVPGASVSRALDVVTAVASASSSDDIAGAIDRAMEQLREKATELGGRAVIAVRSEVQEIGVGFLVIASGTAVELT